MPANLVRNLFCFVLLGFAAAVPSSARPLVSGTILGPSNRPFPNARIELVPVLSNFEAGRLRLAGEADPAPVAEGQSDASGRYVLRAPAVGVFRVVVRGQGQVPMQHTPLLLAGDEELFPVVLSADVGARLRVTDPSGRPLTGAWVFAADAEESEPGGRVSEGWRTDFRIGRTGADGSLSLPRRRGERLNVSVFPPEGVEETRREIEGGSIAVTARGGAFRSLRVVMPRGEPLGGVLVRTGDLSWPVGLTDAEGRLRIPRRQGEPTRLRIVAQDGRQRVIEMPAPGPSDPEMVVELAEPVAISGRVLAQASSKPLAGALIQVSADPGAFLLTDEDGRYRLIAADPEGFQLQALVPGYLPRSVRVTRAHVLSGRAPALALTPTRALRGQVMDAQGAPLAGVALAAVPEIGPGLPEAATDRGSSDAAGRFELRRMRAGRGYELRAVRPGYLPAAVQAVAPDPSREAPPLKIVLTPARAVQGRVQDVNGRPVAGAEISLTGSREPGRPVRSAPAGEPDPADLRTDEKGRFTVEQIPANPLDLTVRKRGYAPAFTRGIRVPPGAGAADLGTIVLRPGARLTGRVTDRNSRPIAGAEVFRVEDLKRIDEMSARLDGDRADAVTSPDGRFVLEDLPAQSPANLLVRARGYLPAGVRGARAPNQEPVAVRLEPATLLRGQVIDEARQPVASARLQLVLGAERPVTRLAVSDRDGHFEILDVPRGTGALSVQAHGFVPIEDLQVTLPRPEPGGALTLTLEKGALLTGRISLTDGTPVSGARVSAAGSTALSDDDGAYAVEGVAPGPAVVGVLHPSYRQYSKEMIIEPGRNQLDVTFEPGVEVTGRVVDDRDAPVPGAWVQLSSQPGRDLEYRARAAADGTFRLSPVAQGRYRLHAGHEDYSPAELKGVVVADEPVGGLEIALLRGGAISGRVLGLKPEELAQVNVEAESAGRSYPAIVDSEGRYEVRRLEPGDYLVRARLVAGQRQAQARAVLEPGRPEVTRDLEFSRRLTLSGQVLHENETLPEAVLTIRGSRFAVERSVVTDYQGGFRFEDLDPDIYSLGLNHPGEHLVHNENVELTDDREIVVRLRTATLSGLVKDGKSGSPVSGALVLLRHVAGAEGPEFLISGGTEQDGSFLLSRVPSGSYRMTVSAGGYAPGEQEIAVPAGHDVAGLEVALEPTQGLDLTVRLASGKVPALVNVRVLAPSGAPVVAETRAPDPSGTLRLPTVPAGSWQLFLSAPGGAVAGSSVTVPGEPGAVTLPEAARLHVHVPALASSDLIAVLSLGGADQQPFWTLGPGGAIQERWPLVGGKATVEGLPAGLWQIRVEAPDGHTWTGNVTTSGRSDVGVELE